MLVHFKALGSTQLDCTFPVALRAVATNLTSLFLGALRCAHSCLWAAGGWQSKGAARDHCVYSVCNVLILQ